MNDDSKNNPSNERKEPLSIEGNLVIGLLLTPFVSVIPNSINIFRYGYSKATAWLAGCTYTACLIFVLSFMLVDAIGQGLSLVLILICHGLFYLHQKALFKKHTEKYEAPSVNDNSRIHTVFGVTFGLALLFSINIWSVTIRDQAPKLSDANMERFSQTTESSVINQPSQKKDSARLRLNEIGVNGSYRVELVDFRFFGGDALNNPGEGLLYLLIDTVIENVGVENVLVSTLLQLQVVDQENYVYSYEWTGLKDSKSNTDIFLPSKTKVHSTTSFIVPKDNELFRVLFTNIYETNETIEWELWNNY